MGSISFTDIGKRVADSLHWTWNHCWFQEAPHPHEPAASVYSVTVGVIRSWGISPVPFQLVASMRHHARSARKALLSRMTWRSFAVDSSAIMRLRNDLPGLTILHAWCRRPMRDSSSFLRHTFLSCHVSRVSRILASLSLGRRRVRVSVSNSIHRNVRQVLGPSHLSRARGTPNSAHVSTTILKLSAHCEELGVPG